MGIFHVRGMIQVFVALWDVAWFLWQWLCPRPPHKERSFIDLVHYERATFKKPKVFGVPFFQKGDKRGLTTQDTKDPILL